MPMRRTSLNAGNQFVGSSMSLDICRQALSAFHIRTNMAATFRFLMVSVLTIMCGLMCVHTELVLNEKDEHEFDFDGLPGAQHEFKIEVPAGREECFFQYAKEGSNLYLNFEVVRGGDRTISVFVVRGPEVVDTHYEATEGHTKDTTPETLHYHLCFDNSHSRFQSKLVYVRIATLVIESWNAYFLEIAEIEGLAVNFTAILAGVEMSLVDVDQHQIHSRLNVMRDWYLIKGNNIYIGYWSIAQSVLVVLAAAAQVIFLRRLFTVPVVTKTSKPRA